MISYFDARCRLLMLSSILPLLLPEQGQFLMVARSRNHAMCLGALSQEPLYHRTPVGLAEDSGWPALHRTHLA